MSDEGPGMMAVDNIERHGGDSFNRREKLWRTVSGRLEPGFGRPNYFSPDANSGPAGHGERRLCVSGASHAHVASIGGSGNEECI